MLLLLVGAPVVGWLAGGAPARFDVPEIGTLQRSTAARAVTPEFLALLLGLTALHRRLHRRDRARRHPGGAARPGRGRRARWACRARQALRLVMLPQALRVIIPPLTNQYLNLTKNSSLAVAIGYPDLVSIANTVAEPDRPGASSASPSSWRCT